MVRRHELEGTCRCRAQGLEAFIPVYNAYVLVKIAQRPSYWIILYCIPVVGVVMGIIMIYELLHVFKFRKTWQTATVMANFGLYLGYLNYQKVKVLGKDDTFIKKNLGEGINSIFFAIVVATIIRSTTFEAYHTHKLRWKRVLW